MTIRPFKYSALAVALTFGLSMSAAAQVDEDVAEDATEAMEDLDEAQQVLRDMRADAELARALQNAKGVFIVPDYGRAALGVGVRGGEGVLLLNRNNQWTSPTFYDFGGISAGLEAGAEAGSIAMILTNDRAVNEFMQNNNWSLNADAGLTLINWSAKAQASVGKGDVIVWSDTEGLLGDLSISLTDINFDEEETGAFYNQQNVNRQNILIGVIKVPADRQAAMDRQASADTDTMDLDETLDENTSASANAEDIDVDVPEVDADVDADVDVKEDEGD